MIEARLKPLAKQRIAITVAVGVALLFLFGRLWSEMAEGDADRLDRAILQWFRLHDRPGQPIGPPWLQQAMVDITGLGSETVLILIVALTAALLCAYQLRRMALLLVVWTAMGAGLVAIVKAIALRPRPPLIQHLITVHSASFPSGHAANSAVVYLTVGALLLRVQRLPSGRMICFGAAVLLTIVIGVSRIYLGVHWASDVLGGWLLGTAWASLGWLFAWHWAEHR